MEDIRKQLCGVKCATENHEESGSSILSEGWVLMKVPGGKDEMSLGRNLGARPKAEQPGKPVCGHGVARVIKLESPERGPVPSTQGLCETQRVQRRE